MEERTNQDPKEEERSLNFIEQVVTKDIQEGVNLGRVQTRFPPEPNGYLHIGHAKAVCIDFGVAQKFGGVCNLRFDDTNPTKEDVEYVDAILEDIQWLGFKVANIYYASDYFQKLYDFAERLILEGHAYVDELSATEIAEQKGTLTMPGKNSPYRDRPREESLELFRKMNAGEIEEGKMTLRAKIDMASSNMHMRDPIIYRIIKYPHHRTGSKWHVYPMYDFAHGQSDYFEGVTHSICTLEFVPHRPLYDYFVDLLMPEGTTYRPRQYEFNRLNLTYTVMSKRKLLYLVKNNYVKGWDDPRMPTLCGLRRRGYTPESIKNFIDSIGYTKYDGVIDMALLEHAVREDLNKKATRVSAVLHPVKLTITNYPDGEKELFEAIDNPEDPQSPTHTIPFSKHLWIEQADFMEDAPKKYFRLSPDGREVRLKSAYIIRCMGCKKDESGRVVEVFAEYDPETLSGRSESNRKVKGTIHWVPFEEALDVEVRLYDTLFKDEIPQEIEGESFENLLNPSSEEIISHAKVEPFLASATLSTPYQFVRTGYFALDPDSSEDKLVFNRTVSLRDSWKKVAEK
ncbi:glutamine--tRNA ligase [Bacteroidales bacterium KA00251]|nr:glutamine--tRNA ligase [Bacteroidales bacterium KA00251]